MRLTEKQRRFVEAYMGQAKGNATEAARLAGYSGDDATLATLGYDNLRKPHIREAIQQRVVDDPLVATREDLQRFWSRVMWGSEPDGTHPETGEPMSPAMRDRLKASELLAKSRGEFTEVVKVTTSRDERIRELAGRIDDLDDDALVSFIEETSKNPGKGG